MIVCGVRVCGAGIINQDNKILGEQIRDRYGWKYAMIANKLQSVRGTAPDARPADAFGYVSNVLSKFQHDTPKHPQHTPYRYVTPVYGAKTQYATKDETPPLTATQCITIQKVTGSVLYYARAVDPTVLMPLNDIATEQTKATEKTQAAIN
jgi:hypothetical protein